jgi:hypothetical protein
MVPGSIILSRAPQIVEIAKPDPKLMKVVADTNVIVSGVMQTFSASDPIEGSLSSHPLHLSGST